ncbi:NAD(P)-binding domain-containing protein [Candidatus Gracilibacteria bacterium]|nr:NAD(P)-binding domain-containing protein [Candidatus Gracilibacteria bacterium]
MKILILGLGAFGFSVAKHLGENNPDLEIFGYTRNSDTSKIIAQTKQHPYFFSGHSLPNNITVVSDYSEVMHDADVVILATHVRFVRDLLRDIQPMLKDGVILVNLAKGIEIESNCTISQIVEEEMKGKSYEYAVLSGGMIAEEVVIGADLGTDIGVSSKATGEILYNIFSGRNLEVVIKDDIINIELYGSLKNIIAIIIGYYEGKSYGKSSIGRYIVEFYEEMKDIIYLYGGNKHVDFSSYSVGGDIIATCFGGSRNKYFGQLLGLGHTTKEAIEILKKEKKYTEGYDTFQAVYAKVKDREGCEMTKYFFKKIFEDQNKS